MTKKLWLVLACSCLFTNSLLAENYKFDLTVLKQKIDLAIKKVEQTSKQNWSYQISRYENEEGDISSSLEKYQPNTELNKQWSLISINGKVPTKKQQSKFIKQKTKQNNKNEESRSYSIKLRQLINDDSLRFKYENAEHVAMNFKVKLAKLGSDSEGKLDGELLFNKQDEFIEEIKVTNNADFSPMFSASISELLITFHFMKIDDAILPKANNLKMKGTFAYFSEINEVSTDTYSNYQFHP